MTTLIISDLHLGSRASSAAAKLDALARVAGMFDRVIFNGDTLDRCYVDPRSDETASKFLEAVLTRCGGRNGPPELLSGNHDPAAATDRHHVYDDESQTLIFHGDTLADCTHPTKLTDQQLMAKLRERWDELGGRPTEFETLQRHYRDVQLKWLPVINPYKKAKTAWEYTKSLLYPPRRPFDVINYWRRAPGLALKLARGFPQPFKRVVVGHTHRSGRWNFDGVEVFNTGSFMPFSKSMVVILEGEHIRFKALDELIAALPAVRISGTVFENNQKAPVQSR